MKRPGLPSTAVTALLAGAVVLYGLPAPAASATGSPGTPEAIGTAHGLATFAVAMDALADDPAFATKLPLTDRSPADVLGLTTLFTRTLATPLAAFDGDYADLADTIGDASETGVTYTVPGGVTVNGAVATFTLHAVVHGEQDVPIAYVRPGSAPDDVNPRPAISVHGAAGTGTVPVGMTLTLDVPFRMDKAVVAADGTTIDVPNALSLDPAAATMTLATDGDSHDDDLSFTGRYGFTEVTVSGRAAYALTGATTFTDPDAAGSVTQAEWTSTLLPDWAAFALTDPPGTTKPVDVALTFDSSLLPSGTHGGTVSYADTGAPTYVDRRAVDSAAPAPNAPVVALQGLEPFTRIGADDALTGLSEFAAAMSTAQAKIDPRLPLLDKRFSDAFSPAGELQSLVEHQGSAAIVCGKADTQPPTGGDLAGTTWYCQAVTKDPIANVSWHRADGTTTGIAGATTATTAGPQPTTNITVTGVDGEPDVQVTFDVTAEQPDGTTATRSFTAEPRIRSAQELQAALADLDGATVAVAYDTAKEALTYDVTIAGDPASMRAGFDVGDALRQRTGLSGLKAVTPDDPTDEQANPVTVDVGDVALHATYGLLLQEDLANLDTDKLNGQADRYYARLGSGPEISVASITATADDATFAGKVGYLGVTAYATEWALSASGSGAVLAADLATDPLHTVAGHDGTVIADAVSLRRLLALPDAVTPAFALSFDASFDVAASGSLSALTTGTDQATVDVAWDDFSATTKPVATGNDAYDTYLRLFDVLPLVEGTATNATKSGVTLSDADTDFTTAFGHDLAAGAKLPATLQNATTGATCEDVTVTDAHTLTCNVTGTVDDGTTAGATQAGMSGGRRASVRTGTGTDGAPTFADADGVPVTTAVTDDDTWRAGDTWRVSGDQDALRTLLLENLYDVSNRLDQSTEPGYVTPLPMLGVAPKQLTPQFAALRDVAKSIAARVPVAAQAPAWHATKAAAADDLVLPTQAAATPLLFKATVAGTTGATEPAWPTTAGATVTDGGVTWTAVAPAAVPPATLQDLVTAIGAEMGGTAAVGGVTFSAPNVALTLATIPHPMPDGTTTAAKPHAQLAVTWHGAASLDAPIRMDLSPLTSLDLHGIPRDSGAVGALTVTTASDAKVSLAVPLAPDIPSGDVVVRADTGVTNLTATADDSTVDLTANVGSIALALGGAARLFGRHQPVSGKHTASNVVSGTLTSFTYNGTAGSGSTGGTLSDPATDFQSIGVATGATVSSGGNSCTVTGITQHTLTCALNNSATWASGAAYALSQGGNAKTATASGLAAPGFTALIAGDVIRQGTANCVVTATTHTTTTTADCPISSGTWDATKSFVVERGAVLTDATRTGAATADAATRAFTTFLGAGGTGTVVTDLTKSNASCSVGTVTGTTVACTSGTALSGGAVWQQGDDYRLDLGDRAKVLVDPGAGFDTMGLTGRTLRNTTDNATCVVASATKDTLTCTAALTGGATWDAGDYYEIQGPGVMKANLVSWSLGGAVDDDPAGYASDTNLAVSANGALVQPSCGDVVGTATVGDACAVLAAQLVDPDAPHGTAASVAGNVVGATALASSVKKGTRVRNDSAAFSCVVSAVTASSFTCPAPAGKAWANGNAWRVDEGRYLGVLTYQATFATGTSVAGGLGDTFKDAVKGDEPLQFSLLTVAMGMLKGYVEDGLDGTLAAEPFPLVGLDRTAGAHVLDGLQALEDELAETAPPAYTSIAQFKKDIAHYVKDAVANAGTGTSLLKVLTTGGTDGTGITVTLECRLTPSSAAHTCADGTDTDENISDVRVAGTIGGDAAKAARLVQGCSSATCDPAAASVHLPRFDTGLPGLELDGPNGLDAQVAWTYDLDFGMARDVGPYLGTTVTPAGGTADPALEVGASVHLPDAGSCTTANVPAGAAAGQTAETGSANGGFSNTRCYQATLGLLQGIVYDGTGDPLSTTDGTNADRTGLKLKATLDLSPAAAGDPAGKGRISLDALTSPSLALPSFLADAAGNIDLYFVTGVTTGGSPAGTTLPSLQGTVHVGFDVHGALNDAGADATAFTDISYADLQMDAGSFVNDFMQPIVAQLYALTRPFKTVADILMAPIPVLKEIAALTGQSLGTLLDLLEQAAAKPLALVRSVVGMVQLVSDLAAKAASTLVGLGAYGNGVQAKGGFKVAKKNATKGTCGATVDGKKQPKDCTKSFKQAGTSYKQSTVQLANCPAAGCTGKELARTMTRGKSVQKFQGMGLSFPFLNDTSAVMGLLVGENATLVRFDTGTFGVTTSLSYSWGPFMAGPVPVDISIGGTIGLSARFAVGYDTRGIMNMLKQERDAFDPSALVDGIFIDDLDAAGTDVDEIQLTFVVTLGASVSISIFKVGLYGGVGITIGFDLVDPDHDGKLYLDEIEEFLDNPICLFKVQGLLDFFFGFFVEVDLKLWSKRWDVELFRLKPPIKLFEVECARTTPDLAVAEGANLRLNIGDGTAPDGHTYAFNRHYKSTRTQEKFVVRQLAPYDATKATPVQVEFSGLVQTDSVPVGGRLVADAGSNNDVVELASGATEAGVEIPFEVPATVGGGSGDDKLTTGAGGDTVTGGTGADKIVTGAGDDTADGGDDTLTGGPGLNATQAATARTRNPDLTEAGAAALLDGDDTLVGGLGNDTLSGHFGNDTLLGGAFASTACTASTSGDGDDQLDGEAGDDTLAGDAGDDRLSGSSGNDTLCGGAGHDLLEGDTATSTTPGDDTLRGGSGNDRLLARGGADVLDGGTGDDLLDAGPGDDRATGGAGADAVDAGDGSDIVLGDTGTIPTTAVVATAGSDVKSLVTSDSGADATAGTTPIVCRPSANVVTGGLLDLDGDGAADSGRFLGHRVTAGVVRNEDGTAFDGTLGDRVVTTGLVQGGAASVAGLATALRAGNGASSDCVVGGAGNDAVLAGPGDDTVLGDAGRDYVAGDAGNDYLRGYQDADELDGGAGGDDVYGDTGNDVATGGAGNDTVHGGIGNDTAYGGPGDDTVSGEDGTDILVGGSPTAATADGADTVDGGADNDVIAGDNAAPDTAHTGVTLHDLGTASFAGNDVLGGQTGDDTIYGQGGDDTIHGHEQNDALYGNAGADTIDGNGGNDLIAGGTAQDGVADGGDTIHGNQGTDTIYGDNGVPATATFHDGAGADTIYGDEADDTIYGQGGGDTISGNAGNDRIAGGSGAAGHADGGDTIHGNDGTDTVLGDNGVPATLTFHDGDGNDVVHGDAQDDLVFGQGGADTIDGDAGNDRLAGGSGAAAHDDGGDTIHGGDGTDAIAGDNATISATFAVTPLDLRTGGATVGSEAGDDTITGDAANDTIYATGGADDVHGNDGDDYVEGGSGADTIHGDAGTDRIIGGSSTADVADSGDTIDGDADRDVVAGDNATIGATGAVALLDVRTHGGTTSYEAGGDTIHGDGGDDTVYGQSGDDTVTGDDGADYLEGNGGADTIHGNAGTDRITGGSGVDNGGANGALRELRDAPDAGDTIGGDGDADVATGDNARLDANGTVTLYDEDVSGEQVPPADVSGGDTMTGDAGTDRLYGQGGDDTMSGGTENDVMEGNTGADTMAGDAGDDDLAGGTMRDGKIRDGGVPGPNATTRGDTMSGGDGVDVLLGDNGTVTGAGATARWTFFDLDPAAGPHPAADLSGPDTMSGDAGTDWVLGQGGDDTISGGTEDDRVQGGPGADTVTGDAGADDVVGGSAVHYVGTVLTALPGRADGGDTIAGNDGADVVVADNGRIDRTGATDPNTGAAVRTVTLFDVQVAGQAAQPANAAGADTVTGGTGRDLVFGGGADDTLHGDAGDDHVEGGAGADTLTGDADDDDLVGGGSPLANGVVRLTAPAATAAATVTNLADGNDTIDGGTGEDAVLADNGVVARTLSALGAWTYHAAPFGEVPRRVVQAPVAHEVAGAFGNDTVTGGAGHDELHGELGNDTVSGDAGDDAVLGDLGLVTPSVNGTAAGQNGRAQKVLTDSAGFLNETVYATGSLQRDVALYDLATGGTDVLDGGTGNDSVHGGAGNDTLTGNAGATDAHPGLTTFCPTTIAATCDRDALFGDDGDDWLWGGLDKDHVYGGYGTDHLDVVRPGTANPKAKFVGPDVLYGGWQQDALQGDLSSPSPNMLDKLIDSTGSYNIYYVCEGAYGGASVVRTPSPSMQSTLQALATADGATAVTTKGSSGFDELSMVFTNEFSQNSSPTFLDSPGNFTCG